MADVKKTVTTTKETDTKAGKATSVAEPAKKTEAPVAEKKTTEKESAKTVAEKTETEKKETAKKPGKKPGRKPGRKPAAKKTEKPAKKSASTAREDQIFLEYDEKTVLSSDIISKIEEAYKAEGHRVGAIKKMEVYVNVSEDKAYYVINGKAEGKFVEL